MINYIVSFDNLNPSLGKYFYECHEDFHNFIIEHPELLNDYEEIPTSKTYIHYINKTTIKYNSKPFVYIAYSHGNSTQFGCNGIPYICSLNAGCFINSFFYSTACLTGKKIAYDLIDKGCKVFVGYKEPSHVFTKDEYRKISINCDNYAIKMFLLMDVTIGEAVNSMKRYITREIDKLDAKAEDPIYISALIANREALVCLGDSSIKKDDIYC